ncbi:MAG TPA: exodeoxyribonuclease VII small subunit [Thermoanaerobacterales bacterium]|jgi:exodeoxyribonuclease VII small subunit|nr:exodeoxyribonuclease VII small subunit [Thermoanaerobacterales bacterium]
MSSDIKYEKAVKRLEEIAEKLEVGNLSLDESLALFEEGIKLINICSKILDKAEGKIEILEKDLNGNIFCKEIDDGGINKIE